jgi:WD40 repeat protein
MMRTIRRRGFSWIALLIGYSMTGCATAPAPSALPAPSADVIVTPVSPPIDVRSYRERFTWKIESSPRDFALAPNGEFALVSLVNSDPSRFTLLDLGGGTMSHLDLDLPFHSASTAHALAIAPDGARFAAGFIGRLVIVNLEDRSIHQAIDYTYAANQARGSFNDLAYTPGGEQIVGISNDVVWWDAASGEPLGTIHGLQGPRRLSVVKADRVGLVLGDALEIRRRGDKDALCRFDGRPSAVMVSPDGAEIAAAFDDGPVRVLRIDGCAPSIEWPAQTHFVPSLTWTPDGKHVITGSADGTIRIWNSKSGDLVHAFEAHADGTTGVALSSDGRRLMTVGWGDRAVKLWEAEPGS